MWETDNIVILLIILLSFRKERGLNCNLPLSCFRETPCMQAVYTVLFFFFGADPIILWVMKNLFISNTTHRARLWLVRIFLPPTIILLVVVMAHGPPRSALHSLLLLHLVPTIPAIGEFQWIINVFGDNKYI
jgi:hypothetical protein